MIYDITVVHRDGHYHKAFFKKSPQDAIELAWNVAKDGFSIKQEDGSIDIWPAQAIDIIKLSPNYDC